MPANTAAAPPISLHLFTIYHSSGSSPTEGATVLCLNAISRRTVNICHQRIYISCYYLLGLGLRAVCLRVLDFRQHELSAEEGSSRNHGAACRCFSSGCPIYQRPKWFQFCSTQRNEEFLMTSIFIRCSVSPVSLFSVSTVVSQTCHENTSNRLQCTQCIYSERLGIENLKAS